jgi:hypothetical protein
MPANAPHAATRFAPQQLAGAAIEASLFILPAGQGMVVLAKAVGFGALVASQTSVLLLTGALWLFSAACFIIGHIPPTARPKIFAILADPSLSVGSKLKATFTNWFSLLAIASQLLWIVTLVWL